MGKKRKKKYSFDKTKKRKPDFDKTKQRKPEFEKSGQKKQSFDKSNQKQKFSKPKKEELNPNVCFIKGKVATKNLTPGFRVYSEIIVKKGNDEYRIWDEKKSKLGAAIKKGITHWNIPVGNKVLYLGIADGTTASHISDMIGENGIIYGVEFALKPVQNLLCIIKMHRRDNIAPIYDNAKLPGNYASIVSKADLIYQDVAQRDQVEILLRNAKLFLKKNGIIMLALKARSVDSTKNPRQVYDDTLNELKKHFRILDWKILDPFEKDHCFIIANKL